MDRSEVKRRVVVEVVCNVELTEGAVRRAVDAALGQAAPTHWRAHGVVPSSVRCKQFSRVVAGLGGTDE